MKKVTEIKVGDYIFHRCCDLPLMTQAFRVIKIDKSGNSYRLETMPFGDSLCKPCIVDVEPEYIGGNKIPYLGDTEQFWWQTEWCVDNNGIGYYIDKNSDDAIKREYRLIQEDIDVVDLIDCETRGISDIVRHNKDKEQGYILAQRMSDNKYFTLDKNNFYKSFQRIY